jgi:hypothetical protein
VKKGLLIVSILILAAIVSVAFAQTVNWQPIDLKYSPNRHFNGFCSNETMCFNGATECISGDINLCSCLNNTQFTGDYYCDSGNWTTRTRLVASQLLAFAEENSHSNYSLFCGNLTETGLLEKLDGISANNFDKICVLKYGNNFGFGTALKTAPNIALSPYINGCPTATSGRFTKCTDLKSGATGKFYYNSNISSIIYLQSGTLAPTPERPFYEQFRDFVKNPFAVLKDFLFGNEPDDELQQKLLNNTQLFDKLYIAKAGSKSIFALLQQGQYDTAPSGIKTSYDYMIINYTGFPNVPVCDMSYSGDLEGLIGRQGASCDTANGIHTVRYISGYSDDIYPYWLDLTSKLRPT